MPKGLAIITQATSETSETKSKNRTFRRFVTTIYGKDGTVPVPPDWDVIKQKIEFFAYAHEVCPDTKRPHLQCYGYCKFPMRLTGIVKILQRPENSHNHVEEMVARFDQNEDYCDKQGILTKLGVEPCQGQRNDLIDVKMLLDKGKRPMEIADEHPENFAAVMKFERSFEKYYQYKRRKTLQDDRSMPEVHIRWGPPGTGKTRWLDDTFGTNGWIRVPDKGTKWFDNCDSDVVLFDDVKINEIPPLGVILELTDRYPLQVQVKNGFITWKPRVIVFTSNYHPSQWWKIDDKQTSYEAFLRRVTKIDYVVYKEPEDHGDQKKENLDQTQDLSWEEEEDELQESDGSSQASGPASYCSDSGNEAV